MRAVSGSHPARIALAYAVAFGPVPSSELLPIRPCVVTTLTVDGLPLVRHAYCFWAGFEWIPLPRDIDHRTIITIQPKED